MSAAKAATSTAETTQIIQTIRRADGVMGCHTRRMYQRQGTSHLQRAHARR